MGRADSGGLVAAGVQVEILPNDRLVRIFTLTLDRIQQAIAHGAPRPITAWIGLC